jgi:hypothetical protein
MFARSMRSLNDAQLPNLRVNSADLQQYSWSVDKHNLNRRDRKRRTAIERDNVFGIDLTPSLGNWASEIDGIEVCIVGFSSE